MNKASARAHAIRLDYFSAAFDAFVPSPDDNPENVPFYRVSCGLRAAWGWDWETGYYRSLLHGVACYTTYSGIKTPDGYYETALNVLRSYLRDWNTGELREHPPSRSSWWQREPAEPTEKDVLSFFRTEYKRAYPGNRVNSKHAKAMWLVKKDQATEIMRNEYLKHLESYQIMKDEHEAREVTKRERWLGAIHEEAFQEDEVRRILGC